MLSLVMATVSLVFKRDYLLEYFYFSQLLALTHLVTLGFLSSLMMGVLHRLSPTLLGVEASSYWVGRAQFGFYFVGVWGMIAHFWMDEPTGVSWSTFLVWVASFLQIWNFRGLFKIRGKNAWPARFMASSLVYFLLAATLGILLGLLKGYDVRAPILTTHYIDNVFAHAHLAGVGWVAMMIFGVELKLVPTTVGGPRFLPVRFALLNIGTLGVAFAFLTDVSVAPFAVLLAFAFLWQAWGPARALVKGRAHEWELLPLTLLLLAAVTGVALSFGWPDVADPARGRVQLAYGFLGVFGFMVLTVVTVAFKLFPMWVWKERFQKDFGKKPVPGMKELASDKLRLVANVGIFAGVLLTAVAIVISSPMLLNISTPLILLGVICFVANFVRVARWELLKKDYKPTEADWTKFKEMFPDA
ncbi:MAG: hypothetical protein BMS9Abin37_1461 [Acidobacteriota bacterium]|nr:MAG: hypothetical protein BMS9Abin37_1461 [Acidobacteriota bacterium]